MSTTHQLNDGNKDDNSLKRSTLHSKTFSMLHITEPWTTRLIHIPHNVDTFSHYFQKSINKILKNKTGKLEWDELMRNVVEGPEMLIGRWDVVDGNDRRVGKQCAGFQLQYTTWLNGTAQLTVADDPLLIGTCLIIRLHCQLLTCSNTHRLLTLKPNIMFKFIHHINIQTEQWV